MKNSLLFFILTFFFILYVPFFVYGIEKKTLLDRHGKPIHNDVIKEIEKTSHRSTELGHQQNIYVKTAPFRSTLKKKFGFYPWGTGIGYSEFCFIDINNDSKKELIFASGKDLSPNSMVSIAEVKNENYHIIDQIHFNVTHYISKILTIHQDNTPYIMVAYDNKIAFYNPYQKMIEKELQLSYDFGVIMDMEFITGGDFDNDLLVVGLSYSQIINPQTLKSKAKYSFSATDVTVGNFTGAPNPQVATVDGSIYELTAQHSKLVWKTDNFGYHLLAIDINKDGVDELVTKNRTIITLYNVAAQMLIWRKQISDYFGSLFISDINGDGIKEIFHSDYSRISGLDAKTGDLIFRVYDSESDVTQLFVEDLDGDGALEVAWSTGFFSNHPDYFFVYDIHLKQKEFQSQYLEPPFHAYAWGNLNYDGIQDIAVAPYACSEDSSIVHVFDGNTYDLFWKSFNYYPMEGVIDLAIGNTGYNKGQEIWVGSTGYFRSYLNIYDVFSPWSDTISVGERFINALKMTDVNGDGVSDAIVSLGYNPAGLSNFITIHDGKTRENILLSPDFSNGWTDITNIDTIDIDNDGKIEVIFTLYKEIYIYDIQTNTYKILNFRDAGWVTATEKEVYALNLSGGLYEMTPDLRFEKRINLCGGIPGPMTYSSERLFFVCDNQVGAFDLIDHEIMWEEKLNLLDVWKIKTSISGEKEFLMIGGSGVEVFENTNFESE